MVGGARGHPSPSPPRDDFREGRMRSDRMDARRDASPRRFSPATLFVGGLNFATDEATLRDACEAHGEVDSVKIIYDHDTRRSRGFAFVTFEREADARRAAEAMDGRNVDGRRVRCNLADERRRGGDVAGASDRRDFLATRRDEHDRRDESERRKRRRRSVSPSGPSDDENEFEPDENEAPRVAALESLLAKTRREAVAQRARADAAEAALARAVSQRNAEKNEGDSAADSAPSQALRAALRLTLRAMAELEAARPATRRALDALERA